MAITAQMVKELRESTGAGMMDCKKALQEAEGNMERAVDILREKGLSKAAKKADRIAAEGLVAIEINEDNIQDLGLSKKARCYDDHGRNSCRGI